MSCDENKGKGKHILLCSLGLRAVKTNYSLNGKNSEKEISTLALLDLLPHEDLPDSVYVLCTKEAKQKTYPILEKGLGDIPSFPIDIPIGSSEEEIYGMLETVINSIHEVCYLRIISLHL